MTGAAPHPDIPTQAERETRNAALLAADTETGFWDDHGRPAPWPEDLKNWTPDTQQPRTPEPGQPPF